MKNKIIKVSKKEYCTHTMKPKYLLGTKGILWNGCPCIYVKKIEKDLSK